MVPALCEVAGGAWEAAASGTLQHGLWGARVGPVLAIQAGTVALIGAAAVEVVEWVVRWQPQGRSRSVDLAPAGSITTAESRSLTLAGVRGVVGAWTSASGLRRVAATRLPRPRKSLFPFWEWAHPGIFGRWGHVTSPQNMFGWLFRPLCVIMVYGLGVGRLGASGSFRSAHNVHLCEKKAKSPNV